MKSKKMCDTDGCENGATCAGLCNQCYQYAHYWKHRGIAATVRHKKKLRIRTARIEAMVPNRTRETRGRAVRENRISLN